MIKIDIRQVQNHMDKVVHGTVEETLNFMLDAEADQLCNADRYQCNQACKDTRVDYYQRKLHTKAVQVNLKVPKLRKTTFETAIIEGYRHRESSVEEALIEMYLAGVSVRRVEDINEVLWGTRVGPSTISKLNKKLYKHIERWWNRSLETIYPYVYLDGFRKVLGIYEGAKEGEKGWSDSLSHLKQQGLRVIRLIFRTNDWDWLNRRLGIFHRWPGSGAVFIGIATSFLICRTPKSRK